MRLTFWRFQIILFILYFFWGNFFTGDSLVSQAAFNFAVFYPVGFLEGYWPAPTGKWTVYVAGVSFNVFTYLVVLIAGVPWPKGETVIIDFVSMALFIWAGTWIGRRLA